MAGLAACIALAEAAFLIDVMYLRTGRSSVIAAGSRGVHSGTLVTVAAAWCYVCVADCRLGFSGMFCARREFPRVYRGKWHRQH